MLNFLNCVLLKEGMSELSTFKTTLFQLNLSVHNLLAEISTKSPRFPGPATTSSRLNQPDLPQVNSLSQQRN